MKEIDVQLQLAIQRLLSDGSIDKSERTPLPADWTTEKEELFLKCSAHARACRMRKSQILAETLSVLLQRIKAADPREKGYIKWVLELPGKHLPTEEDRAAFNSMFNRLLADERQDPELRQNMRESVEKFGWLYAALFPLIGQHVRTPHGTGDCQLFLRGNVRFGKTEVTRFIAFPHPRFIQMGQDLQRLFGSREKWKRERGTGNEFLG